MARNETLTWIIFVLVFVVLTFFGGFYLGSSRRVEIMGNRITELESLLEQEAERVRTIRIKLAESERTASELAEESGRLAEENRVLADRLGNMGVGLAEDQGRIDSVVEGIRKYTNPVKKTD